ncbi:hypothetical protein TDB9533_03895 [Thalassocella blandensis]|nr:hypothetical protein TDB9533_03895 [Thalassocella blandensis]
MNDFCAAYIKTKLTVFSKNLRIGLMAALPALAFVQCAGAYAEDSEVRNATIIKDNLPVLIQEDLDASAQVYMYEFSYDTPTVVFELSSSSNMKLQIRENDLPSGSTFDCEASMTEGKARCAINHRGGVVFVKVVPEEEISNSAILTSHFTLATELQVAGSY